MVHHNIIMVHHNIIMVNIRYVYPVWHVYSLQSRSTQYGIFAFLSACTYTVSRWECYTQHIKLSFKAFVHDYNFEIYELI